MLASNRHNRIAKWLLVLASVGLLFVFFTAFTPTASADTLGIEPVEETLVLGGGDIRVIIARIINTVLGLLGIITVSIMVYAGYVWMTSGGSEERIAFAKKTLINATIGLIIILSAMSIVSFIINALLRATGPSGPGPGDVTPPAFDNFSGSGALGHIVQDHYPFRDQSGVARNTKIVVTFREPISPTSVIKNATAEPVGDTYGVCADDGDFSWEEDCDRLATSSVHIYRTDDPEKIAVEAAVTIAYLGDDAKTFVFRPLEFLGDDLNDVAYTVQLTNDLKKKDGSVVFDQWEPYYWEFETGTEFDFTPPRVSWTVPKQNKAMFRNNILQLTFNEPVDPTLVQGIISTDGEGAYNPGTFTNVIFGTPTGVTSTGQWQITNGYRTIEFLSDQPCGRNSCGDVMYCVPALDIEANTDYDVVVRTAATIGTTWESIPFTGVADMAGNALDAGIADLREGKPAVGVPPTHLDTPGEYEPDNYHWEFEVKNKIDFSVPHVQQITPIIDQENVVGDVPLVINFSHVMWLSTLEAIGLIEHIPPSVTLPPGETLPPITNVKRSELMGPEDFEWTQTELLHREFGPNNLPLYYFTELPGTVKASNQNCLYPGRGPSPVGIADGDGFTCEFVVNEDGSTTDNKCIPVSAMSSSTDTGCAHGGTLDDILMPDVDACRAHLETVST